jgi:hypothetical protein
MNKVFICLMALVMMAGVVMKAEADPSDAITVTVTLRNVSVSITAGHPWAIGVLGAGQSSSGHSCTAENDGNVVEDFFAKVGNSSPGSWAPGGSAGTDQFVMNLTDLGALTGSDQEFASNVAIDGSDVFELTFTAPSASDDDSQQTITVTITAAVAAP